MIITNAVLDAIRLTLSTAFQGGLGMATTQYGRIASTIPSSSAANIYPMLKDMPGMREWIGPRRLHSAAEMTYTVPNKDFEDTLVIPRNAILDDQIGQFAPFAQGLGMAAAAKPDLLCFAQLKAGFTTNCADGQFFFDVDHPVIAEDGTQLSVANTDGGTGLPWFLMCTTKPLKPILFQDRQTPQFAALDQQTDANVFMNKEFVYGVDARWGTGFAYWQLAWGSKQPLTPASYEAARGAMMSFKGDYGRPLGIVPDLLVVPPLLEGDAREIITAERTTSGATNVWRNTAEVMTCPWLA